MNQSPPLAYRIFLLIFFCILLILNTFTGLGLPIMNKIDCTIDSTFTNTEEINSFLQKFKDKNIQGPILIIISLLSDCLFVYQCIRWIQLGKSFRFVFEIVALYAIKICFGLIFRLETPLGYLMTYPGIPSITISYLNTNAFFFNGTIGLLTILIKEFYYSKKEMLMLFTIFDILLYSSSLIFLRANYCIDILFGVLFGDFIDEIFRNWFYKEYKAAIIKELSNSI